MDSPSQRPLCLNGFFVRGWLNAQHSGVPGVHRFLSALESGLYSTHVALVVLSSRDVATRRKIRTRGYDSW